jgi:hypothetical protein
MPGSCEVVIVTSPVPRADDRRLVAEILPRMATAARSSGRSASWTTLASEPIPTAGTKRRGSLERNRPA